MRPDWVAVKVRVGKVFGTDASFRCWVLDVATNTSRALGIALVRAVCGDRIQRNRERVDDAVNQRTRDGVTFGRDIAKPTVPPRGTHTLEVKQISLPIDNVLSSGKGRGSIGTEILTSATVLTGAFRCAHFELVIVNVVRF
jgi:hypothetical protein